MAETEFLAYCNSNAQAAEWRDELDNADLVDSVTALPANDSRRLVLLDPRRLKVVLSSGDIHLKVSTYVKAIMDMVFIQRSANSVLPMAEGNPISLRSLFKRVTKKTAIALRTPLEEVEYQYFHGLGAT
jgi:hypothetical protein